MQWRQPVALTLVLGIAGCSVAESPEAATMKLTSSAFADGGGIPMKYTCDGEDVSPPLAWTDVPPGVQSFALLVTDPDAGGFVHWVRDGIPGDAGELSEGDGAPNVRPGENSFGRTGWSGPCPPSGEHRYVFTLYALSSQLEHGSGIRIDAGGVRALMEGRILAVGRLTGTYARRPR